MGTEVACIERSDALAWSSKVPYVSSIAAAKAQGEACVIRWPLPGRRTQQLRPVYTPVRADGYLAFCTGAPRPKALLPGAEHWTLQFVKVLYGAGKLATGEKALGLLDEREEYVMFNFWAEDFSAAREKIPRILVAMSLRSDARG